MWNYQQKVQNIISTQFVNNMDRFDDLCTISFIHVKLPFYTLKEELHP